MAIVRKTLPWLVFGAMAGLVGCEGIVDTPGFRIVGLTDRNEIVAFTAEAPNLARVTPISGTGGRLIGIDYRLNRDLYGIGSDNVVYRINTETGAARRSAALAQALPQSSSYTVDFDPHFDGLRVITAEGQSLRVNVDNGRVQIERPVAYDPKDRNAGKKPSITAGAYINAYPGSFATQLFDYDSSNSAYVIQDPPESGRLVTVGSSGLPAGTRIAAFDIVTDIQYEYHGFAIVGTTLHRVNVGRGTLTRIGDVGIESGRNLIDIAIVPKLYPRPPGKDGGYE